MNVSSHLRGILYAILGFTAWVVVDALIKLAAEAQLPPYEVVGASGTCATVIILLRATSKAGLKGGVKSLWPRNIKMQIFFMLCSLLSNYTNVVALKNLPLTVFYVVAFTAPMMIAIAARVFLKESIGWMKFLAILTGFGGVVIAVNPQNLSGSPIGYIACTVSAAAFAGNVVSSRFLMRDENPESLIFFSGFSQAVTSLAIALVMGQMPALTLPVFLILITAGSLNVVGNFSTIVAVKYAPPATVAPYHYTQIIAGALVAYLVWHEQPSIELIVGAAIIIASGIYIATHGSKTEAGAITVAATGTRE